MAFNVAHPLSRPLLSGLWAAFYFLAGIAAAQNSGALEGSVRDAHGRACGAATVYLQRKSSQQILTSKAGPDGRYRFSGLQPGDYLVRAESGASYPISLADNQTKEFDLTAQYAFFDEPNFIVAGVSDPGARGGHGSDTVLRSTEALAKATAELTGESPAMQTGSPLETVRAYQRAAEMDASEAHLFDWGAELLVHRAAEPAAEVFAKGHRLFPHSQRLLLGLAAAWYARGDYEQAAQRFFEACDLNPEDPGPYMFLGKVQSVEIATLPAYLERLERFAKLRPDSAWANYYYAVGLSKQRKGPEDSETPARIRDLLERAIRLDPSLAAAYLQLGILYSGQNDDRHAIAAYQKAIELNPGMDEAHYRLGQAYGRTGQKEKARQELETYEQLSTKLQQEIERQRSEIQQFVIELKDKSPAAPPR